MFLRVLSAMMAADWIDRQLRAQPQARLAEPSARPAAAHAPPLHGGDVHRTVGGRSGWDPRAPERPT
jgi:hypothetical protein